MTITKRSRKISITVILAVVLAFAFAGCAGRSDDKKLPVKVLILPKFEVGEIAGDFPGEAQFFYEEYLTGGEVFEIGRNPEQGKLYYRDGVAMSVLGQGKVNAALGTAAVLSDERFDFSDAYILCVGCGGVAKGYGTFGDVFVISATVDLDLGHRADGRDALLATETYGCRYPYAISEMEDIAAAQAVKSYGALDRLIILRTGVNIDVFPSDLTPEMLWGADTDDHVASDDSLESVDIFETAMKNCFDVGKVLIDAILEGSI